MHFGGQISFIVALLRAVCHDRGTGFACEFLSVWKEMRDGNRQDLRVEWQYLVDKTAEIPISWVAALTRGVC